MKNFIHVYSWAAELDSISLDRDVENCLTVGERIRASRFRNELDRSSFLRGRSFLRCVLATHIGLSPDQIEITTGCNGKPEIGHEGDWHFNFSRSGNFAVCGVTNGRRIGIDVEYAKSISDMESVAQVIFNSDDKQIWAACPDAEKRSLFYRAWTRKEAKGKADGSGISAGASDICVPLSKLEYGHSLIIEGITNRQVSGQEGGACNRWCLSDWPIFELAPVAMVVELHQDEAVIAFRDEQNPELHRAFPLTRKIASTIRAFELSTGTVQ